MTKPQTPVAVTWESALDELARRRGEFHAQGYVPRDFIDKLIALGVHRAAAPRRFGGEPLPPADFVQVVERVAKVDGSAGWVAFASALTYPGSLPLETQAEIYRDGPDVVHAGGLFPLQSGQPTASGYLVDGRRQFASGCMAADWISVGIPDDGGSGLPRAAALRRDQVKIVKEWDVTGMRRSGSFDVVVDQVGVEREWTFVRGGPRNIDEPLSRYPLIGYQAQVHSAVALASHRPRWSRSGGWCPHRHHRRSPARRTCLLPHRLRQGVRRCALRAGFPPRRRRGGVADHGGG